MTKGYSTWVDDDVWEWASKLKWHAAVRASGPYASRHDNDDHGRVVLLHRLVTGAKKGESVDHINHDTLLNIRANLRICTSSQNIGNSRATTRGTSIYKGVSWHKATQKYRAVIMFHRKYIYLGLFVNEVDAALVYDKAARELFKEFACLNFPDGI